MVATNFTQINDDYFEYIRELRLYRKANPPKTKYRARAWIDSYPELKTDFQRQLIEAEIERGELIKVIKHKLAFYPTLVSPYDLICEELVSLRQGQRLIDIEKKIRWLRLGLSEVEFKNSLSPEQIQEAREFPLDELINTKRIKNTFCCPFHEERTPSFQIYNDGHWHCFGCGVSGSNSIDFVMKKQNLAFPEAVKYLSGGQNGH